MAIAWVGGGSPAARPPTPAARRGRRGKENRQEFHAPILEKRRRRVTAGGALGAVGRKRADDSPGVAAGPRSSGKMPRTRNSCWIVAANMERGRRQRDRGTRPFVAVLSRQGSPAPRRCVARASDHRSKGRFMTFPFVRFGALTLAAGLILAAGGAFAQATKPDPARRLRPRRRLRARPPRRQRPGEARSDRRCRRRGPRSAARTRARARKSATPRAISARRPTSRRPWRSPSIRWPTRIGASLASCCRSACCCGPASVW